MNKSKSIFFGGKKCEHIADQLSCHYDNLLVFSICSDERIGSELENYLFNISEEAIPSHIVILGDFPVVPPKICPPSFEVLRILSTRTNRKVAISLCWLDSAIINFTSINKSVFLWHNNFIDHVCFDGAKASKPITQKITSKDYFLYSSICGILKAKPLVEINENGFIFSIKFVNNSIYPRSLISQLLPEDLETIYEIISKFSNLKLLDLSFSSLKNLPNLHHCKMLEHLDLRGNLGLSLDMLEVFHRLKYLNISACGIKKIPITIEFLSCLESLLCYKNSIENVKNLKFPEQLIRLSLYRNNIREGKINLSSCTRIKEVNMGANPLNYIDIKLPSTSKSLRLRVRNTPKSLTTIVKTPQFKIEPIILRD